MYKNKKIRKNFKKTKRMATLPVVPRNQYGSPTTVKLKDFRTGASGLLGFYNGVFQIDVLARGGGDWASFADTYGFYVVRYVSIKIYPFSSTLGLVSGVAYDPVNSTAFGNYDGPIQRKYYTTFRNTGNKDFYKIAFPISPQGTMPKSTSTITGPEFGYLKWWIDGVGTNLNVFNLVSTCVMDFYARN